MAGDSGIPGHLPHQLAAWWEHGAGAAKIAWGTPGDFDRCVRLAVTDASMTPERAKGFCAERHHAALGIWPATHAKMEKASMDLPGSPADERFNPNHVPGGAGGGQFTSGGGGGSGASSKPTAKAPASKPKAAVKPRKPLPAVPPNGLGYTDAQWKQLRQWEAMAKAGKPLTAHQLHLLHQAHVAHETHLAHVAAAAKKAPPAHAAHAAPAKKAPPKGPPVHKAGRSAMDGKPYGDVAYADPKNGKYPIDTAAHAKAAWDYVNQADNAAKYPLNGVTLAEVKNRIMAACKHFGVTVSDTDGDMNSAHFAAGLDVVRSGEGITLEAAGDGSLGLLTGRFSEFGRWYRVRSALEGDFMERVAPGATADTIRNDLPGMRVLFDHGMDGQIGNKVLGPIRSLEERSDGPHYAVPLFDTSYNRDLLPGLRAGVYGASMRMRVTGDEWDDKPQRSESNPDGIPERTITGMKVPEFGPVTFPANPGASAGVRSATDEFYARLAQADAPAFADAARSCGLSLEDFAGRITARSGPGREQDVQPGNGRTSPPPNNRTALRERAWRMREVR